MTVAANERDLEPLVENHEWINETAAAIWRRTQELAFDPEFYEVVEETPLLTVSDEALPEDLKNSGYTLLVKHEGLQPTGAYKLRGATSALIGYKGGVAVASTGNAAIGTAYAAQILDTGPVDVMCLVDTSKAKLANMECFGAVPHPDFETLPEAMDAAQEAGKRTGVLFLHAYDNPDVIAGAGTIGIEIAARLRELNLDDAQVTIHLPGGGGGIASGVSVAATNCLPHTECFVNQSQGAAGIEAALQGRVLERVDTAVDGAAVKEPGKIAMEVIRDPRYVSGVNVHTNGRVGEAMSFLGKIHEVPEPAGALSVAGALQYMREHPRAPGDTTPHVIVAITSGTVVTPDKVLEFMQAAVNEGTLTGQQANATYSKAYAERTIYGVDEIFTRILGNTVVRPNLLSGPTTGLRRKA